MQDTNACAGLGVADNTLCRHLLRSKPHVLPRRASVPRLKQLVCFGVRECVCPVHMQKRLGGDKSSEALDAVLPRQERPCTRNRLAACSGGSDDGCRAAGQQRHGGPGRL